MELKEAIAELKDLVSGIRLCTPDHKTALKIAISHLETLQKVREAGGVEKRKESMRIIIPLSGDGEKGRVEMSVDGASLGIDAQRSLEAVLGGKQPKKEERRTPEQMRRYLMSSPDSYAEGAKNYGEAARWLAKQYLVLLEEGFEGELYDEVKRRQGNISMDFTGFMVGWAQNAARYCKNLIEKPNPAIIEIRT